MAGSVCGFPWHSSHWSLVSFPFGPNKSCNTSNTGTDRAQIWLVKFAFKSSFHAKHVETTCLHLNSCLTTNWLELAPCHCTQDHPGCGVAAAISPGCQGANTWLLTCTWAQSRWNWFPGFKSSRVWMVPGKMVRFWLFYCIYCIYRY